MKRHVASKHDSREYIQRIEQSDGIRLDVQKSAQVEIVEPEEGIRFIIVDGKYTFTEESTSAGRDVVGQPDASKMGDFVPFVGSQTVTSLLPSVYIDPGAIRFILKGADVMRPGILDYDDWGELGKLVVIRDQEKKRGIAVGRSLVPSAQMKELSKGNCVKNLHYAGDKVWDAYKRI